MFKKILSLTLAVGMVIGGAACSSSQVSTAMSLINSSLPTVLSEASAITSLAGNQKLSDILQIAATDAKTDAPVIKAAVLAWQQNKTAGNLAAAAAAVSSLASNVNDQFIQAQGLAVTTDDKLAVASLGALSLTLNGLVIALQSAGVKTSMNTMPHEILPYVTHDEVQKAANEFNVSYDQAITAISGM